MVAPVQLFSQTMIYALQALPAIPDPGEGLAQISKISGSTGIPRPYLSKLMTCLTHGGFILAKRGIGGGISLGHPAKEIYLWDLQKFLEHTDEDPPCPLGLMGCAEAKPCSLCCFWRGEWERFKALMKTTTILDIRREHLASPNLPAWTPDLGVWSGPPCCPTDPDCHEDELQSCSCSSSAVVPSRF